MNSLDKSRTFHLTSIPCVPLENSMGPNMKLSKNWCMFFGKALIKDLCSKCYISRSTHQGRASGVRQSHNGEDEEIGRRLQVENLCCVFVVADRIVGGAMVMATGVELGLNLWIRRQRNHLCDVLPTWCWRGNAVLLAWCPRNNFAPPGIRTHDLVSMRACANQLS